VSHDDSLHLDQGFGSLIGDNFLKSIGIGCIISPNLSLIDQQMANLRAVLLAEKNGKILG
jgi:hypothetical protein